MEFSDYIDRIVSLVKGNPIPAVVLGIILLIIMFRRPKLFFTLIFLILFIAGVFYLIMSMASSGNMQKGKLLEKQQREMENIR